MTTQRFLTYVAVAGGLAFLVKLVVLAATDGADSAAVATLWFSGVSLCAIGSIGIALSLLEDRPRWLRIVASVLAPFVFLAVFSLLDSTLVPLTEDRLPFWAEAEAGVFTAALIWLAGGVWTLRRQPPRQAPVTG